MKKIIISLAATAAAFACLSAGPAFAQEGEVVDMFRCESTGNGHNECRYDARGDVTVHVNRQLSSARCVFDESWGTFDGGVWVDYGCRAEFVVRRPPESRESYRPVGGTRDTIRCESQGNRQQACRVDNIDISSVTIERRLSSSPCVRGETWGVSDGENSPPGIWVDRGCRATFAFETRGGSRRDDYGGTPHDFELPCESLRGEWQHCNVHHVHQARIELINGTNECNDYKAWGVDDTGIWVRNKCQAAFSVRYRY